MVFISEEEFSAHDIHQPLELVPRIWFFSWCFHKTTQEGPNNISVSFLFLLKWTFQKHPLSWVCEGQCCLIISGKFNIYCINVCACFSWFWLISNSNLTSSWYYSDSNNHFTCRRLHGVQLKLMLSDVFLYTFHFQSMFIFLHYLKGTPFQTADQGKSRRLTHWEQLNNGEQFTGTRKFFTLVPIFL